MLFIHRYNHKLCAKRNNQIRYNNVRTDDDAYKSRDGDVMTISQKTQQATPVPANNTKKNDYSHIWEFPLPDPKQERVQEGTYRGVRSMDSAYGTSLISGNIRTGNDEGYHVSMTSRGTEDSRYFVLDHESRDHREARDPCTPIPDDPEC